MEQRTRRSRSRTMSQWAAGFSLLMIVVAGDAPRARTAESAAERFFRAGEVPLTQYRAYRRLHAQSEKFGQEAWMEAWTELDQQGFRYTVVSEKGSDYIRNKVLKAVLNREQELVAAGDCRRSELTADNYVFEEAPVAGGERYVLLKPKRKDMLLVDGRMVLSRDGTDVLRVEGRLSKNPSFWTSLVNVVRHYARLDGVRVPIATESTAKVKLAGEARLDVRYEYESINGHAVSVAARRSASQLASATPLAQ
jgi:hypothetical protein